MKRLNKLPLCISDNSNSYQAHINDSEAREACSIAFEIMMIRKVKFIHFRAANECFKQPLNFSQKRAAL